MPVITLTTDFGLRDHYAASLRGALISRLPAATVVEITHQVSQFDIGEAAYILGRAFRDFPDDSVHIVAVASGGGGRFPHVAIRLAKHFFIGCDNGLFSLLADETPAEIVTLATRDSEPSTFLARDLYLPAAIKLAGGTPLAQLGPAQSGIAQRQRHVSPPELGTIKGNVLYVDSFGNLITNITREEFQRVGRGRSFSIQLIGDEISTLHKTYGDVPEGEKLAFFNSAGVLEIAVNNGNASGLFMMRVNTLVRISFE